MWRAIADQHCEFPLLVEAQLQLSDRIAPFKVEPNDKTRSYDPEFEEDALLAAAVGVPLYCDETVTVRGSSKSPLGELAIVAAVAPETLSAVRSMFLSANCKAGNPRPDVVQQIISILGEDLRDRLQWTEQELAPNGFAVIHADGKQLTTAPGRRRIGLHFDSFEGGDVRARNNTRNRISLNIGSYPRFVLVVLRTCESLSRTLSPDSRVTLPELQKRVVALARSDEGLRGLRVRVNPGEFYGLATENLLHDGATTPGAGRDITFTLRGDFRLRG